MVSRRISLDLGTAHGSIWGQGLDVRNLLTNGLREKYCMTHTELQSTNDKANGTKC